MKRPETVFVRNNGKTSHTDRFDGEDFTIEPGQKVELTVDAARLCFGFGENDKSRAIRRLGWASTSNDQSKALDRLNRFSFLMNGEDDTGHLSAPVVTDPPAPSSQSNGAGDDSGTDDPVVRVPDRKLVRPLEKLAQAHVAG